MNDIETLESLGLFGYDDCLRSEYGQPTKSYCWWLFEGIAMLPEKEQIALFARFVLGYKLREIAVILDLTQEPARQTIERGLHRLRYLFWMNDDERILNKIMRLNREQRNKNKKQKTKR